jgi:hypothetical protein
MRYRSGIRMSIGWVYPIGIFTSYILLILEFEIRRYLGTIGFDLAGVPYITILLISLMFIILGIIQWNRYRNWIYPVLGFLIGLSTVQVSFFFPDYDNPGIFRITYFISFIIVILFVILNWTTIYHHERFEINSRRLFRLASQAIYRSENGFTERPYSGGRIECTRDELLGYARYLQGNFIAMPFYYDGSVCLSFSMNKSLMVIADGKEVSHVIIGFDGSITVKVSEKDYLDYRSKLSFDQLCASLADIFSRFLDYYRKGLESRITIELKAARKNK